jgi:fucose permease
MNSTYSSTVPPLLPKVSITGRQLGRPTIVSALAPYIYISAPMATTSHLTTMLDSGLQPKIASPAPILQKAQTGLEMANLNFDTRPNGQAHGVSPPATPPPGAHNPLTPHELESVPPRPPTPISRSSSSLSRPSVAVSPSLKSPPRNMSRFINACLISIVLGLNDSAPGALLPYIEDYYSISYGTVSLIFVAYAIGFVSAAPFTKWLQLKLGRGWFLFLSQMLVVVEYIVIVIRPPFVAMVLSFYISGLGSAWTLSVNNVFVTGLKNSTSLLGVFHGCYGVGGILGPLIATGFVSSGRSWSDFYYVTLGLAAFNAISAYWTSRGYEKEQQSQAPLQPDAGQSSRLRALLKTLRNRTTLLGAAFIFAYQGAEVSLSGWILSFLLTTRPHPASQTVSMGYITSGFWGGITLGRFILSHVMQRMGERLAVFVLIIGSAIFQLLVWFVPNIIGEAVAVAFVGLLLGPIYAFAIAAYNRLLNRDELVSALSFVSAMGSSGGAVAPFITGIISQKTGIWVVNPIAIGLFGAMALAWLLLPRTPKRRE